MATVAPASTKVTWRMRVHVQSAEPCRERLPPPAPTPSEWERMEAKLPPRDEDSALEVTCAQDLVNAGPFVVYSNWRGALMLLERGVELERHGDHLARFNEYTATPLDGAVETVILRGWFEGVYDAVVRFEYAQGA